MKRIYIFLLLLSFLLTGCTTALPSSTDSNTDVSPSANTDSPTETSVPKSVSGWRKEGNKTYYIKEDGSRCTGWLEMDGNRYYLDKDGILQTGWLNLDGKQYYLQADGSVTQGKATIGQDTYYFTSQGVKTVVVNPWNTVPADYTPNLVHVEGGYKVDAACRDALEQMLADCRNAGFDPIICSAYRDHDLQIELYDNKVSYYLNRGYEYDEACRMAGRVVAVPGTSEHELGLALDLVDNGHRDLDESQEDTPTQKWLMENCWKYGFILRYPTSKTEHTGIIYEPWHYRYVGKELAMELQDSGLCLEEYFVSLS